MKYKPPGHCNSIGFETPGKHLTKFLHDLGSGKNPGPLLSQIVFVFVLAAVVGFAIVVVVVVVAGVVVVVVDVVVLGFRVVVVVVLGTVVVVMGLALVPQSTLRGQSQNPGLPSLAGCQNRLAGHFCKVPRLLWQRKNVLQSD